MGHQIQEEGTDYFFFFMHLSYPIELIHVKNELQAFRVSFLFFPFKIA